MRLLWDTHAILWFMLGDAQLSATASALIGAPENECLFSPASHWEMAIKISIGKYEIDEDFETLWRDVEKRFGVLHIEPRHTTRLIDFPFHHRDPFDRLLVAQALVEGIPLVSRDATLDAYGVRRIW